MVGTVVGRVVSRYWTNMGTRGNKGFHLRIKLDEDVEVPIARNGNIEDAGKVAVHSLGSTSRAAGLIAALTNNRPCHATQIGIVDNGAS